MDATADWPEDVVSIEYVPKSGKSKGQKIRLYYKDNERNLVMWLKDTVVIDNGTPFKTDNLANLWLDIQYNNLTREGDVQFPNGKKPEKIISNILHLVTSEGDLVMDFNIGSGTTCAVAHKMKRRYIGIEQMDYVESISVQRLRRVIDGEQGGISISEGWQGGGSFVYAELAQANEAFIQRILTSASEEDLAQVWQDMQERAFLSYRVDVRSIDSTTRDWQALSLDDKKRLLMETLDKNMLYVPLSEMEDPTWGVSEADKALNRGFFGV